MPATHSSNKRILMRNKVRTILLATAYLAAMWPQASRAQRIVRDSLVINGHMRHFKMLLPDRLSVKAPLVLALHGYGSKVSVERWMQSPTDTWMNEAAVRHDFALCVPLGLKDKTGRRGWNVRYPSQEGWEMDDVSTVEQLARHVQKKYGLSKANTFLTGMSNGGEMCYVLNYKRQSVFRALASVAGLTLTWMFEEREKSRPIPFMEIHGTEDRTSEWTGDLENKFGWGCYMSVPDAVAHIVEKNGCKPLPTDTVKGKSFDKDGHLVVHHRFANPRTHNDVWLYEVIGAGHNWFLSDMDTGEEIWKFFSRYLKK